MEELVDILDEYTGEKTGEVISRDEAHRTGKWHGSIHVLIVNKDRSKTLLQKRCEQKELYPNMWDIAVGGHISASEDDLTSVKRELEEELGIDLEELKIEKVDRITEKLRNNGIISNEYVSIFVTYSDVDINEIKLQAEEVSKAKWCTKQELNRLVTEKKVVPHTREYEILNEVLRDE